MKKSKLGIIFLAAIMMCFLSGCSNKEKEEISWEQTTCKVTYGNIRTEYDYTEYDKTVYYFESACMDVDEKEEYIQKISDYIEKISFGEQSENEIEPVISVYIGDSINTTCVPNEMYINTEDINKPYTYFQMFQALYGDEVCLGQAYGLAVLAYEEAGLGTVDEVYTDEELASYLAEEETNFILDFTLPLFSNEYIDEETVKYVESAAVAYTKYVKEEYGEDKIYETLLGEDDKARTEMKNCWLKSIGVETEYDNASYVHFSYNIDEDREEYPFVVFDELVNWYFYPKDVKEEGYSIWVKRFLETREVAHEDFMESRELLKKYIVNDDLVSVYIRLSDYESKFPSLYDGNIKKIFIYEDWNLVEKNLLHEYIHFLTLGKDKLFKLNAGLVEGATEYMAVLLCENNLLQMYLKDVFSEDDWAFAKEINVYDSETDSVDAKRHLYYRATWLYKGMMDGEYTSISLKNVEKSEEMHLNQLTYEAGASMTEYLIEQYGMDAVFNSCLSEEAIEKLCGKSFSEIYEDWGAWNEERYLES